MTTIEMAEDFLDNYGISGPESMSLDRVLSEEHFLNFVQKQEKHEYSMGVAITKIQEMREHIVSLQQINVETNKLLNQLLIDEWNLSAPGINRIREFMNKLTPNK
jgi:hypothetical protein